MTVPSFDLAILDQLAAVLGDTDHGLTGSQIEKHLADARIPDPGPITKRRRLEKALRDKQQQDQCGNNIVAFLQEVMNPVRHHHQEAWFQNTRRALNTVLLFAGLNLNDEGKVQRAAPVTTLSDARKRADRLRSELDRRDVHPEVLRFCREELLAEDHFHAVLEATKSVAQRIRSLTGLTADGAPLVDEAFSFTADPTPHLALNTLTTESERSEQKGFMNLLKGLFGTFRNPTAHHPRISWPISEADALDILSLVSLVYRRLDAAVPAKRLSQGLA